MSNKIFIRATLTEKFAEAVKWTGVEDNMQALTIMLIADRKNAGVRFDIDNGELMVGSFVNRQDAEETLQRLRQLKSIKSAYIQPAFFSR